MTCWCVTSFCPPKNDIKEMKRDKNIFQRQTLHWMRRSIHSDIHFSLWQLCNCSGNTTKSDIHVLFLLLIIIKCIIALPSQRSFKSQLQRIHCCRSLWQRSCLVAARVWCECFVAAREHFNKSDVTWMQLLLSLQEVFFQ